MTNLMIVMMVFVLPLALACLLRGAVDEEDCKLEIGPYKVTGLLFEYIVWFTMTFLIYSIYQGITASIMVFLEFFGRIF